MAALWLDMLAKCLAALAARQRLSGVLSLCAANR